MSDNRKVAAVGEYVKNILKREMIPQPDPPPTRPELYIQEFFTKCQIMSTFLALRLGKCMVV